MTQHIVSISSGLSSALVYRRVLDRYGADNVLGVFMDTLIEDEDNYRFLAEIERWGRPFVRLIEGRNPYQVATDQNIIPNQKIAPCTEVLKIIPFRRWLDSQPLFGTVHLGYDYTEVHRCAAPRRNYEEMGFFVDFPLLWKPYELRPYADVARNDWGIEPPAMYAEGYSHANCGRRCVKQGQGDWLRTYVNRPADYAEAEEWERLMRQHPNRQNYALLRDQTGGTTKPLTLEALRLRYEAGQVGAMELNEPAPCVTCGVGG